jgi:RNA recognition motif-containing protein
MRIFVGNLAWSVDDAGLQDIFAPYGEVVSATVMIDRATGRSKGFGFVEMPSAGDAQKAINALNGKDVSGRPLTVNEARPREERAGGGDRGGYRGGGGGGGGRGRY